MLLAHYVVGERRCCGRSLAQSAHILCCSSTDLGTMSTAHIIGPLFGWRQALLRKVASWLKPGGQVFIHIFCHKTVPYHFEVCAVPLWVELCLDCMSS